MLAMVRALIYDPRASNNMTPPKEFKDGQIRNHQDQTGEHRRYWFLLCNQEKSAHANRKNGHEEV
jgi:hypothetical protein